MGKFKRLDSMEVSFADCFARQALKVNEEKTHRNGEKAKKGTGEKRIYCGSNQEELDAFFEFDKNPIFFIEKIDLEKYYSDIAKEYMIPSYPFGDSLEDTIFIYQQYNEKLTSLQDDRLYLKFSPKYDRQHRYYLCFPPKGKENAVYHENWDYVRDICLPRVTRLVFTKLIDEETGQLNIYIKAGYIGHPEDEKIETKVLTEPLGRENDNSERLERFRSAVLENYPSCVITGVTDVEVLEICRIKDLKFCNKKEEYDRFNGLTMTPTLKKLFEKGYISFDEDGNLILSDHIRNADLRALHLNRRIQIEINEETKPYLKWHNGNRFLRTSRGE